MRCFRSNEGIECKLCAEAEAGDEATTAMVYGLGWGPVGASIGAAALAWIPVVGPAVGGLVGGMVGYMAGSKFGETVFNGIKAVRKGVVSICKAARNTIKRVGNRIPYILS